MKHTVKTNPGQQSINQVSFGIHVYTKFLLENQYLSKLIST